MNLRSVKDINEILNAFCLMYVEKSPTLIWQNHTDRRVKVKSHISKVNFDEGVIEVTTYEKLGFSKFKNDLTFYLRGELKSILFKSEKVRSHKNKLIVHIPQEVRMYEMRGDQRVDLKNYPPLYVVVEKSVQNLQDKLKNFKFSLINISKGGICFQITGECNKFFYENDEIQITNIDNLKLKEPLKANIVYLRIKEGHAPDGNFISAPKERKEMIWEMGIKFHLPIKQDFINLVVKTAKNKNKVDLIS